MKQVVTKGIVLARTDFGEADRILTILTNDQGKIRAIAKGVRKIKSKLAGGIELFSISQISYIRGKSDIYTLTSTRLEKHYSFIAKDINRTMYAYEVLKIFNQATEFDAESAYFEILTNSLEALNNEKMEQPLIHFWLCLQILKLSGQTPNLKTDKAGKKLLEDCKYNFNIDSMCFVAHQRGAYDSQSIKLLRLGLSLESPKALAKVEGLNKILPDCLELTKIITRQAGI